MGRFPSTHLTKCCLSIWRRRRESNPPKSDRQSGALPRGLQRHIGIAYGIRTRVHKLKAYVSCPVDERDIIKQDAFLFSPKEKFLTLLLAS